MLEARHAAVIAGLGIAGMVAVPRSAVAWEGAALSAAIADMPIAAFAVGVVGGFAIGGIAYFVTQNGQIRPAKLDGKHFAEYVDELNRDRAVQNTAVTARSAKHMRLDVEPTLPPVGAHARTGRHFASQADAFSPQTLEDRVPSPEIVDYADVAQSYVANERQEKKKAARARGVAAVLLDRIEQKSFPTIARGAAKIENSDSWWVDIEPVTPNVTAVSAPEPELPALTKQEKLALARENAAKRQAAEKITRAVPLVDQGVYPERRSAEELDDGEDLWTTALAAMDELIPSAAFSDTVGNVETIDEPDGLELPTEFLNLETHERVREFYDASAFVDFAVGNDVSQPTVAVEMQQGAGFLKVIEGGSQNTGRLDRRAKSTRESSRDGARESSASVTGKHFAVAVEA